EALMNMKGEENAYQLHQELGEWMTDNVTVVRHNDKLLETDKKIEEMLERWNNINMVDSSRWSNQAVMFTRQLKNMLNLARVITIGDDKRNESLSVHYKAKYPARNNQDVLKTALVEFIQTSASPEFSYEDVDVSLIEPRLRDYTQQH